MVFLPAFGISCAYQIERELLAITVLGCNSVGAGALCCCWVVAVAVPVMLSPRAIAVVVDAVVLEHSLNCNV